MSDPLDGVQAEAEAFDARFTERIENGLVPDLRNLRSVDWFFNNPWRRPQYVDMVFGEYLRFALEHLPHPGSRVLEVGSGLGHMTLEMARNGHFVTGLELSPKSVDIARQHAASVAKEISGSLEYVAEDFTTWKAELPYDAVCFFMTLHHFENVQEFLDRSMALLRPGGVIIVIEPARDWFSQQNALVATLMRLLLASTGRWHETLALPRTETELQQLLDRCVDEYRDAKDRNEAAQSPNDNSCYATDMLTALRERFAEVAYRPGYALVPRMVGGVRSSSEEETQELASFVRLVDDFGVRRGLLQPGAFYYAGRLSPVQSWSQLPGTSPLR